MKEEGRKVRGMREREESGITLLLQVTVCGPLLSSSEANNTI